MQQCLLSEQRLSHDREVDKQVKAFVVETIQFRNSFDTEGPLVPGLTPSEAGSRLGTYDIIVLQLLHGVSNYDIIGKWCHLHGLLQIPSIYRSIE